MPSIEDVPQFFADYFEINLIAAQTILSVVVILTVLLPVLLMTRGRGPLIPIILFFLCEAILVSISWLDSWIMVGTIVMAAMGVAFLGSGTVTGGN
jgi:hypothetical protein